MTYEGQKNPVHRPRMSVDIAGIKLKNPVMAASGTFGYGEEFFPMVDLNHLGAIITKGISLKPMEGNPPPRIVETVSGMINSIGLQNVGVQAFIRDKVPFLSQFKTPVIANIFGETVRDYGELAKRLNDLPVIAGLEVNISCPNVASGGMLFGADPKMAHLVVRTVKRFAHRPVIVKLSPNVTDITLIAKAVEEAGANAISLINTLRAMAIDPQSRRPLLSSIFGGLSGPAIKPVALRLVWEAVNAVKIPVIGIGGIMNSDDALEFIIAGARAVQVGTANFVNPTACIEIIDGIEAYLRENGFQHINELVGSLRTP
ncbi:MAG: dihydroorotate dehydrogenase [Syntrophobacterales bacterium]|nr:MAG: dihydroorotate dehydrogenase [Syntrophobacterales bacterium]